MQRAPGVAVGVRPRLVFTAGGVAVLALLAAVAFPLLDRSLNPAASQPGLVTYLGVGLSVLALTATLLFAGLRAALPRTAVFLAAMFGYNILLILVKFALAPPALYLDQPGSSGYLALGDLGFLAFPGLTVIMAGLYAGAFCLLYLYYRSRLRTRLGVPVQLETRFVVLLLVMFVLAVCGGLTVIGAWGFLEYTVSLLGTAAIGLSIGLALLAAIALCGVAFREAEEQAAALRKVALLSTFAWVGLAFIAAYHVVWLVFVLTLISIWPLKSMTIK